MTAARLMLYALCSMLYALCSMLYALCSLLAEARRSPRKPAEARGSPRKPAEARGSPRKPAEARGSLDFVDNFLRLFRRFFYSFICFALYAVRSSSMQYKSLLPFLKGGGGGGGTGGCVCKSYSMDSLLLSKIKNGTPKLWSYNVWP